MGTYNWHEAYLNIYRKGLNWTSSKTLNLCNFKGCVERVTFLNLTFALT
jgi:hypothetical protein